MKPIKIVLIAIALIAVEITEAPFQKLFAEFGFAPDEVKAAQCLTVSRFLPENEARIWSHAAHEKISYWLEHQSGCSTPNECLQRRLGVINRVEQKAHPDGNSPSQDILEKWKNSDYCQNLVASYRENPGPSDQINSQQEADPAFVPEKQIRNHDSNYDLSYQVPRLAFELKSIYAELSRSDLSPFIPQVEKFLTAPTLFTADCVNSNIEYSRERGRLSEKEAKDWGVNACKQEIQQYQQCLGHIELENTIACFKQMSEQGD